jgi:prophage regulatory protein
MSSPTPVSQARRASLLRLSQVRAATGLGRTTTYALIARGLHPAPLKIGRSSLWVSSEIDAWVDRVVQQRGV